MAIFNKLKGVADKLGLIKIVETQSETTDGQVVQTRSVSLESLITEIHAEQVAILAQDPAERTVSIERVYAAAGVKDPVPGWSALKIFDLVTSTGLKESKRDAAQKALVLSMREDGVDTAMIIADALARDKALDAYEEFVTKKTNDRRVARQRQIDEMQSQIESLKKRCLQLEEENRCDVEGLQQWITSKRGEEDRLHHALSYLVDQPPVTRDHA